MSFVCHLAGKERHFGGQGQRDGDRGTGGSAANGRPRKGDRTCTSSVPLHGVTALLLLLPFFAPACWSLSFTGHYYYTKLLCWKPHVTPEVLNPGWYWLPAFAVLVLMLSSQKHRHFPLPVSLILAFLVPGQDLISSLYLHFSQDLFSLLT